MPRCPKCRAECFEGETVCTACGAVLDAAVTSVLAQPVVVYTASSSVEGEMLCELLKNDGIATVQRETSFGQLAKAYTGDSRFGSEVLVDRSMGEQAKALIEAFFEKQSEELDEQTLAELAESAAPQPAEDNAAFRLLPLILLALIAGVGLLYFVSH